MAGMQVSSSVGMQAASSVVGVEAASSTVFAEPSAFPPGLGLQNIATASMPEHHPDSLEHAFEKLKEAAKAVQPHKSVADMETASSVAAELPASQAASSSSAAAEGAQSAHGTSVHGKVGQGKGNGKGRKRQSAPEGFWEMDVTYDETGKIIVPDGLSSKEMPGLLDTHKNTPFAELKEAAHECMRVAGVEGASSEAGGVPASQAASSSSAAAEGAHSAHGTLVHGKAVKGKGKGKGTRQYAPAGFWNPIITLNDAGKVKWPDLPNAKAKRQFREQVRKMSYNKSKSQGDVRWSPPRFVKELAPPPVCNRCGVMWMQPPQVIVCVQN